MTQLQKVVQQLNSTGEVSRNWCLQNYISRLAAIICDLKKKGWEFTETRNKGDFIYRVAKKEKTANDILEEWKESQKEPKSSQTSLL